MTADYQLFTFLFGVAVRVARRLGRLDPHDLIAYGFFALKSAGRPSRSAVYSAMMDGIRSEQPVHHKLFRKGLRCNQLTEAVAEAIPARDTSQTAIDWWEDALASLYPYQRQVVLLYYRFGWNKYLIARVLNLMHSRVSWILQESISTLRSVGRYGGRG